MPHSIKIKEYIQKWLPEMIDIRQRLHQIPELKYEEYKTAALIAETLRSYGIAIETGIARTGIIATIDSGKPGKTIALRADIDALPIQELTQLTYQSQHENKMHACGHDGHTATLLLVANILHAMKDQLNGKVKILFQPAEEGGKGSLAMIQAGVLENVDAIFGYHNWPGLELGKVGTRSGAILAGNGRFEIMLEGKVAHTSMPENAINPVTIGAKIITEIEHLRKECDSRSIVFNIIRFESGEIKGGMTDSAKILGIYYTENEESLVFLKHSLDLILQKISKETLINYHHHFAEFHTPTINTANETDFVLNTARQILNPKDVIELPKCMVAAEDFSEYLKRVPGCFFLVGAGDNAAAVHTAHYDFPDKIIPVAAMMMANMAVNFLT